MAANTESYKSKYRGVYKCGKRWKAQLQSQGIQYYLGTFDSEEDAARAYDKKARNEKGSKSLTNFTEDGQENIVASSYKAVSPPAISSSTLPNVGHVGEETLDIGMANAVISNRDMDTILRPETQLPQIRTMWDKLWQLTQRLVVTKAMLSKLTEAETQGDTVVHFVQAIKHEIALIVTAREQTENILMQHLKATPLAQPIIPMQYIPNIQALQLVRELPNKPSTNLATMISSSDALNTAERHAKRSREASEEGGDAADGEQGSEVEPTRIVRPREEDFDDSQLTTNSSHGIASVNETSSNAWLKENEDSSASR